MQHTIHCAGYRGVGKPFDESACDCEINPNIRNYWIVELLDGPNWIPLSGVAAFVTEKSADECRAHFQRTFRKRKYRVAHFVRDAA